MSELMPRDYYNPVPIKRDTRKRLARIEQEAMVRQAALEAAAEDAAYQMEAREQLAAGQALLRVKGTYNLAAYAGHRATQLNHAIGVESAGNPRLEQIHRSFEETAAITANLVIYNYGTGG
jgi:hypothetical protein